MKARKESSVYREFSTYCFKYTIDETYFVVDNTDYKKENYYS